MVVSIKARNSSTGFLWSRPLRWTPRPLPPPPPPRLRPSHSHRRPLWRTLVLLSRSPGHRPRSPGPPTSSRPPPAPLPLPPPPRAPSIATDSSPAAQDPTSLSSTSPSRPPPRPPPPQTLVGKTDPAPMRPCFGLSSLGRIWALRRQPRPTDRHLRWPGEALLPPHPPRPLWPFRPLVGIFLGTRLRCPGTPLQSSLRMSFPGSRIFTRGRRGRCRDHLTRWVFSMLGFDRVGHSI